MRLISLLFFIVLLASCKKKESTPCVTLGDLPKGLMVVNEGLFQQNNSTVSFVNDITGQVNNSKFQELTGRQLGDTGNDILKYGGKIYIVVNVSSTIEVLDSKTGKEIQQIIMQSGGQPKQPRRAIGANGKLYVSCFDGFVDVIDTITFAITQRISVGENPDFLAYSSTENRLFVSNTGGLNFPAVDSTISVIDCTSNMETEKITVGKNPGAMAIEGGKLFVITRGNYGTILPKLHRINLSSNLLEETYSYEAVSVSSFKNGELLFRYKSGGTQKLGLFNVTSNSLSNSDFIDLSGVETPYSVGYSLDNERIYITDAKNYTVTGNLLEFDSAGNLLRTFGVGLNPSSWCWVE